MKKSIKILITLSLYFIITLNFSCSDQPTPPKDRFTQWNEDIDYLSSQFKSKQLNFSTLIPEEKFNNTISSIKNSINSLQDYEIYFKLKQLIASLKVAHTLIVPPDRSKFHFLPVYTKKFSDGLYIIQADQQNLNLLGKKIIKVGNFDVSVVEDSLKKLISYENDYWADYQLPGTFSSVEALKYFGFTDDLSKVELEIAGEGKIILNSIEQYNSNFTYGYKSVLGNVALPLYLQNYSSYYWYTFLESNEVLYIEYNKCANAANESFESFTNDIKNFVTSNQVKKIIVDLRNNGGGNSDIIRPLLTYLKSSPFNNAGSLFVIIGNHTFSSGELDAVYFKQETNCLLVGEPTGGKPNSYGEVLSFTLPNTGIYAQYCTKYFTVMSNDPEALFPDYSVDLTSQDFLNGRDPVLDFILNFN